jgi:hypothetical protein
MVAGYNFLPSVLWAFKMILFQMVAGSSSIGYTLNQKSKSLLEIFSAKQALYLSLALMKYSPDSTHFDSHPKRSLMLE